MIFEQILLLHSSFSYIYFKNIYNLRKYIRLFYCIMLIIICLKYGLAPELGITTSKLLSNYPISRLLNNLKIILFSNFNGRMSLTSLDIVNWTSLVGKNVLCGCYLRYLFRLANLKWVVLLHTNVLVGSGWVSRYDYLIWITHSGSTRKISALKYKMLKTKTWFFRLTVSIR